ncbi:unnamed protein product, partial [Prorocentrum cordatum]
PKLFLENSDLPDDAPAEVPHEPGAAGDGHGVGHDEAGGGGRGKGGRKGGKGEGRRKSKVSRNGDDDDAGQGDADGEDGGKTKACGSCKKEKSIKEFYESQNDCKVCRKEDRQMMGMAERQGLTSWLKDLKNKKPAEYAKLKKVVMKVVPNAQGRREFNLVQYKEEMYTRAEVESNKMGKMMWEGEYREFAQSAEGGFLTKDEYEAQWKKWMEDPDHPKDEDGPRGYTQCLVKKGKYISDKEAMGKKKSVEASGKAIKKCDEATAKSLMNQATGGMDVEDNLLNFGQDEKSKALKVKGKKKAAAHDDTEDCSDEEKTSNRTSKADESNQGKGITPKKVSAEEWLNGTGPQKINKANRDCLWDVGKLETTAASRMKDMEAALEDFAKDPDKDKFSSEIKTVKNRLEALGHVLSLDPSKLRYIANVETAAGAADRIASESLGRSSIRSSHDTNPINSAGPCPRYKDLITIAQAKGKVDFNDCQSDEDVKSRKTEISDQYSAIPNLLKFCSTGVSDLYSARTMLHKRRTLEAKAAEEARKKRQKEANAASGAGNGPATKKAKQSQIQTYPIFDVDLPGGRDMFSIPNIPIDALVAFATKHDGDLGTSPCDSIDPEKPLLLPFHVSPAHVESRVGRERSEMQFDNQEEQDRWEESATSLNKGTATLSEEIEGFKEEFRASDLRLTIGRAVSPLPDEECETVVMDWFLNYCQLDKAGFRNVPAPKAAENRQLYNVAGLGCFAIAAGVQDCRVEPSALPTLRGQVGGTRTIVACRVDEVISFLVETKGQSDVTTKMSIEFIKSAIAAD